MLLPIDESLKEWICELDRIPVYPEICGCATIEEICNLIKPSVLWMDKRGFSEDDIAEKVGEVYGINPKHAKVLVERILGELESKEVEEIKA